MPNMVRGKRPRISRPNPEATSRLFLNAYSRYFQRVCRIQAALFEGDLDLLLVAAAIGLAAIEHRIRDPEFKARFGNINVMLGLEGQRGTNAQSVADATGLPRETVRRKIGRLIELGIVARRDGGDYVMQPGTLQSPTFARAFAEVSDETLRMINECIEHDIFVVTVSSE
jgi:hypothetical protein